MSNSVHRRGVIGGLLSRPWKVRAAFQRSNGTKDVRGGAVSFAECFLL